MGALWQAIFPLVHARNAFFSRLSVAKRRRVSIRDAICALSA
jgi:hypothetical protein